MTQLLKLLLLLLLTLQLFLEPSRGERRVRFSVIFRPYLAQLIVQIPVGGRNWNRRGKLGLLLFLLLMLDDRFVMCDWTRVLRLLTWPNQGILAAFEVTLHFGPAFANFTPT
uniref:(northern house mosquito) hypothetical protein n=1 Tax=Culex pipiens TaxID=7175 RepID=A0A8D8AM57_CULPI